MRILIIDNNINPDDWGSRDLRRMAQLAHGAIVSVRRAPHDDLPHLTQGAQSYDRLIVSGSKTSALDDAPWIFHLHDFIRQWISSHKPFLGVCYGHQSLIRSLGSLENVRISPTPEFGWSKIETLEPSPLFEGLSKEFYSFSSHFEEAHILPRGFKRLAQSEWCSNQACVLEGYPVYGIQFHPEKDLEGAKSTLKNRKKLGVPQTLLSADRSEALYDPKVGETLFKNFFNL